jgi:hypothetical protein
MSDDPTPESIPDLSADAGAGTEIEGLSGDLADLDTSLLDIDSGAEVAAGAAAKGPSRLMGLVALLLGVIGCLVALVCAFLALRLLVGAGDTVDDLLQPVEASFDRLDARIDQIDDLIDSGDSIAADQVGEFRARVDGLVDVTELSRRGFESVDRNPLYRLLPADIGGLDDALTDFRTSAETIEEAVGTGTTIRSSSAAAVAGEVDAMQARVADTRSAFDDAADSLRTWLRLGGLAGFVVSLWSLWAQSTLARRGWRGLRARPL